MDTETNLFECFDGIRPMAEKLREKASNVQGWKLNGRIPAGKQPRVLEIAAALGLDVLPQDVVFPLARRARRSVVSTASTPPAEHPSHPSLRGDVSSVVPGGPVVACDRTAFLQREAA